MGQQARRVGGVDDTDGRTQTAQRGQGPIEPLQLLGGERIVRCVSHRKMGPHALKAKARTGLPQSSGNRFELAGRRTHAVHPGVHLQVDGPLGGVR